MSQILCYTTIVTCQYMFNFLSPTMVRSFLFFTNFTILHLNFQLTLNLGEKTQTQKLKLPHRNSLKILLYSFCLQKIHPPAFIPSFVFVFVFSFFILALNAFSFTCPGVWFYDLLCPISDYNREIFKISNEVQETQKRI